MLKSALPRVVSDSALGGEGAGGKDKKLITYSLYGDNPKYCKGAVKNAQLVSKVFPGWQARYYTDMGTVPEHYLRALRTAGADIYPVDMARFGNQSMFWRFWAAADADVERFISRDARQRRKKRVPERASRRALEWPGSAVWAREGRPFLPLVAPPRLARLARRQRC